MEHKIIFFPADDRTNNKPELNYGVNDVNIKFLVIGKRGIVEFDLHTNWYLPHVMERRLLYLKMDVRSGKKDFLLMSWISPGPFDVCYMSLIQMSEDDTFFDGGLDYVFDHQPCFYGYKYEKEENGLWTTYYVYDGFIREGDSFVWNYLEKYYQEVFGDDE